VIKLDILYAAGLLLYLFTETSELEEMNYF